MIHQVEEFTAIFNSEKTSSSEAFVKAKLELKAVQWSMNYSQPVSADTFISLWMYKALQEIANLKFCPSIALLQSFHKKLTYTNRWLIVLEVLNLVVQFVKRQFDEITWTEWLSFTLSLTPWPLSVTQNYKVNLQLFNCRRVWS